jgi:hypothetical protein
MYAFFEKKVLFEQSQNQQAEDGTHQISLKINEKCLRNFKL